MIKNASVAFPQNPKFIASALLMDFTLNCSCGAQLHVATADAGGCKICICGKANAVPSLSELRRRAGKQSYEVGIADKLRSLFTDGELPPNNVCVSCGSPTSNVFACTVVCQRPYSKGRGLWATVLLGIFTPLWNLFALNREYADQEVFGQELVVHTPLPICSPCTAKLQANKHSIRKFLRRVPLYEELLQEYPDAVADASP